MVIIKKLYKQIKRSIKTRFLIFKDQSDVFLGRRYPLSPPKRYDYINIGVNTEISKEFFNYFVEKGGLKETDRVLEVGSGFGRMAIPLTAFLTQDGSYDGLELIKDGVNWCQHNFTPKHPHFKFQRIDVFNDRYNPKGNALASNYEFPFEDCTFDFVYLTSVFTHMYPEEIENYLKEITRVLKIGGTCLITYYLLNEVSLALINQEKGTYNFKYEKENYYIEDQLNPLYQIAFKEAYVRNLYNQCHLKIEPSIYYGSWSGRPDFLSFQDIIIARK